jgi:nucleoside-diphosphate-sugar epimerase
MRVLVTGGGGFLGSAICEQLLTKGHEVLVYQRSAAEQMQKLGAYCVRGDLGNLEQLRRDTRGCDAVIHTAGKAGPWGSYESFYQVNVVGTENVISACRANDIRYLVYTSSPSVVHGGGDIEGGEESLPYPKRFKAAYPATKALGEQLVMAANGDQLKTVGLRPHLIWGPGDPHLLPRLMARAAGGKISLPGSEKLIDTIFIENAARAHVQALDGLVAKSPCSGKTYFISNDQPLPQAEIIGKLLQAAGMDAEIGPIPPLFAVIVGTICQVVWKGLALKSEPPLTRWSAEQLSTAHWYDISAAKQDLGYEPRISIDQGLEILKAYFEN